MANDAAHATPSSNRRLGFLLIILVASIGLGGLLAAASAQSGQVVATALFQVSSDVPTILGERTRPPVDVVSFEIVKKSQLALLKSYYVLTAALRNPAVAALPMLQSQPDPVAWLQDHLEVEYPEDSEILAISFRGPEEQAQDLVQIVDAVAKAYRDEVIYEGSQRELTSRDLLARSLEGLNKQIERKFDEYLTITREVDRLNSGAGKVLQELDLKRLDRVESEIMRLKNEQFRAEADDDSDTAEAIEKRIEQLRQRQADLEKKLTSRAETSVELTARRRELDRLERVADQISIKLEVLDIEAHAPDRILLIQPAVASPAE